MIHSLKLENFKCFQEQSLQFKSLTLLSGLNSTGKSSVLQLLLLLRQSYQQDLLLEKGLALNGDLVCIGTAKDALFEDAEEDAIGFTITWNNELQGKWHFNYNEVADVLDLTSSEVTPEIYQSNLFDDNFHYLQAERIGPRAYLEMGSPVLRVITHAYNRLLSSFPALRMAKICIIKYFLHPAFGRALLGYRNVLNYKNFLN